MDNQLEHQLVIRAKAGDRDAFAKLYEAYAQELLRFCRSQVRDRVESEDVASDVFVRALRAIGSYDDRGHPFRAYLYQIARNAIIDRSRRHVVDSLDAFTLHIATEDTTSQAALRTDMRRLLLDKMRQLSKPHQEILTLRFIQECTSEEIALKLGRPPQAVRSLQHRALNALRTSFADAKVY